MRESERERDHDHSCIQAAEFVSKATEVIRKKDLKTTLSKATKEIKSQRIRQVFYLYRQIGKILKKNHHQEKTTPNNP